MGQERKLKQFRRELKQLRRKNQNQYGVSLVAAKEPLLKDQNAEIDQINGEFEEIDAILKRLMPCSAIFLR